MSQRAYRPPIRTRGAARPARASWHTARLGLVVLACVLALGSLSVAAAHFWSAPVGAPPAAPTSAVAAAVEPTAPAPSTAAAPAAQPAGSHLAALLDPAGPDVSLDVSFGEARKTLQRSDLTALVTGSGSQVTLNTDALQALSASLANEWNQPMVNARFNFNGGNLTPIRQSQEGRTLDKPGAAAAIGQALTDGQPSVTLPGDIVRPQVSSANPQALGITTNLDRGSTSFAGSIPEKQHNIQLAAERLNGVVVPPGGTFSFNDEVGPTTLDAGFQWGFGIEASAGGARTVPSVAGGICQVATTLFQRVFWAGFPLVERHWHLYWIPAYTSRGMVGLDATVDEDSGLDLRWSNPTDGYVLIQSATDDSNVYFGIYGGAHNWKVNVDDPKITNRVASNPAPIAEAEPTLPWGRILPVESARDGFDVAITRTVTREDGQPRSLTVQSSYEPSRTVTLVGTKDKPANADVDAVLARVAPPPPRATPVASASPSPVETNAPVPGTGAVSGEAPPASPTPAKPASAPTATPVPASAGQTPTAAATRAPAGATQAATSAPTSAPAPATATPAPPSTRPPAPGAPTASPATR